MSLKKILSRAASGYARSKTRPKRGRPVKKSTRGSAESQLLRAGMRFLKRKA